MMNRCQSRSYCQCFEAVVHVVDNVPSVFGSWEFGEIGGRNGRQRAFCSPHHASSRTAQALWSSRVCSHHTRCQSSTMAPTQRQATTPRRRTPSRAAKAGGALQRAASGTGSLSPPPPLPRPAVSSIPLDPVKDWLEKEQATDPVFSSKQQIAVVNQSIGGHGIQPYDHAAPILFPNVARMFGLRRWKHRRIPPNKSRGPSCVVVGHAKVVKCHISCIPAFLYK